MNYGENYDLIAREHVAHIAQFGVGSPWVPQAVYEATQRETAAVLAELVKPGMSVLDVGVGPGFALESIQDVPGVQLHGLDIARPYIDRLKALHPSWRLEVGNAEAMPFKENTMDLVLCCDVLEHVLDVHRVMRLVIEVMKPGAMAMLRVPYREDMRGYCARGQRFEFVHVRSFDEYTLRLLIEKCHGQECVDLAVGEEVPGELFGFMRRV